MGKVIAIANHKGGVAKTTTAINFGAALVNLGRKVLLVDMDPQCNLTETLYGGEYEDSVYTGMLSGEPFRVLPIKPGFDVLPGDKGLLYADVKLSGEEYAGRAQRLLRDGLDGLRDAYDFIIIDCPPSRGIITVNALAAADEVIIPTLAEILAVRGIKDMNELIGLVRAELNPKLTLAGLLLVMHGDRTTAAKITSVYIADIAGYIGTKLFATRIRKNVAVVESQMAQKDVFETNPAAKAAQDYLQLAREYLGIAG